MTILDAVWLSILQGFTEFLPVSSSGHLVLLQQLLGTAGPGMVFFDVALHVGTLISLLVVFWKDVVGMIRSLARAIVRGHVVTSYRTDEAVRTAIMVIVASVPAGVVGFVYQKQIEEAFTDPKLVAVNLVITGLVLFLTRLAKPVVGKEVGFWTALLIGVGQAFAILPGISRSGTTISAGMYAKLTPDRAARFSFLMAMPVIAGAGLLEFRHMAGASDPIPLIPTLIGTTVSAVVGYFAIKLLLGIVHRGKFSLFAFYCLLLGTTGILFI